MPCKSVLEKAKDPTPPEDGFFMKAPCFARKLGLCNLALGVDAKLLLATSGGTESFESLGLSYSPSAALDSFACSKVAPGVASGEDTAGRSSSKLRRFE